MKLPIERKFLFFFSPLASLKMHKMLPEREAKSLLMQVL